MSILDKIASFRKLKLNNCVGIYISRECAYVSEVRYDGKSLKVERYIKVPLPDNGKDKPGETMRIAAMNIDVFENDSTWLVPIKTAIEQAKLGTNKVVVTLSPQFGVFRNFFMPYIDRRFWKQSIPIEAKKYVPFALEGSISDFYGYQSSPGPDGKSRMAVLFAITNKKISEALKKGMAKIGVELLGVELSPISAERFFDLNGDNSGGQIHAHFDANVASLQVSYDGIPFLFREVNFDDVQSTERRRLDVKGSMEFVGRQIGADAFKDVKLSGENLDLWKVVLEEDAKLPVVPWDPKAKLKVSELDWGLVAAVGASARYMVPDKDYIDLMGKVKESEEEEKALIVVWVLCILISIFALGSGMITRMEASAKHKELVRLRKQNVPVPEFEGKTSADISEAVRSMRDRADAMSYMFEKSDYVTPKLEAIANSIPPYVWLTSLSYNSYLQVIRGRSGDNVLLMDGGMRTGNRQKDLEASYKFKDLLSAQPAIQDVYGKNIPGTAINFNYNISPGSEAGEAGSVSGGRTDSVFTIRCSRKAEE